MSDVLEEQHGRRLLGGGLGYLELVHLVRALEVGIDLLGRRLLERSTDQADDLEEEVTGGRVVEPVLSPEVVVLADAREAEGLAREPRRQYLVGWQILGPDLRECHEPVSCPSWPSTLRPRSRCSRP